MQKSVKKLLYQNSSDWYSYTHKSEQT